MRPPLSNVPRLVRSLARLRGPPGQRSPKHSNRYDGPSLFECLDNLEPQDRDPAAPFRMPIMDKYREDGKTFIMGKSEAGTVRRGDSLVIMPNRTPVKARARDRAPPSPAAGGLRDGLPDSRGTGRSAPQVSGLFQEATEMAVARPGENIRVRLTGVEEEDISAGFVLCSAVNPTPVVTSFDALLSILELLEHKSIFTAGYKAVMHIHSITEECEARRP